MLWTRLLFIALGVALGVHDYRAWRGGMMPMVFGKDDAELAAERHPRTRRFRLRMIAVVAVLLVTSGAFGRAT